MLRRKFLYKRDMLNVRFLLDIQINMSDMQVNMMSRHQDYAKESESQKYVNIFHALEVNEINLGDYSIKNLD